jgi:two-component system catabolic regulation response regulator CreB
MSSAVLDQRLSPFLVDESRRRIQFAGRELDLSKLEYALLKVFVAKPGRVFSRAQLMDQISDDPGMSLERTIDSHIKSLRAKLRDVDPSDDWIETHRGFGYALKRMER